MPVARRDPVGIAMLHRLLECDPETGRLRWRPRTPDLFKADRQPAEMSCATWNTRFAGTEAFTAIGSDGYHRGGIFGRNYPRSRVVFAMTTGAWPSDLIDHRNAIRTDDRFANLREATDQENKANVGGRSPNRPFTGVFQNGPRTAWYASIFHDGRPIHIGTFPTAEAAAYAWDRKATELRGEFARLNFPEGRHA